MGLSVSASSDSSFASNFDLFDAVLQLFEAVNMKRVDMSTSSAIGEVAGIFQGRKYIKVDVADCFELRVRHSNLSTRDVAAKPYWTRA
jgi:hypothetical protein